MAVGVVVQGLSPLLVVGYDSDRFYYGFCNRTIWPLFHYLPSYVAYEADYWDSYKRVNEVYFQSLKEIIRPDDLVGYRQRRAWSHCSAEVPGRRGAGGAFRQHPACQRP